MDLLVQNMLETTKSTKLDGSDLRAFQLFCYVSILKTGSVSFEKFKLTPLKLLSRNCDLPGKASFCHHFINPFISLRVGK